MHNNGLYQPTDPRKEKRYLRRYHPEPYMAYLIGESDGLQGKRRPNLYPPGRRRDEYNRGFSRVSIRRT